eukprot:scaffold10580_cov93-Isochrysis_galbana.AAC.2
MPQPAWHCSVSRGTWQARRSGVTVRVRDKYTSVGLLFRNPYVHSALVFRRCFEVCNLLKHERKSQLDSKNRSPTEVYFYRVWVRGRIWVKNRARARARIGTGNQAGLRPGAPMGCGRGSAARGAQ